VDSGWCDSGRSGCASWDGEGGREEVEAPGDGDHGSGEYMMFVLEKWTLFVMVERR
jgi:hypothetical protein